MAEINKNPKLQTDKRKSSHSLPSILLGIKGKGNKRERYKRNRISKQLTLTLAVIRSAKIERNAI